MEDYIQKLRNIGLTENQAKVYVCLLRRQVFTATEISKCSGVNRSRIYSVLSSLVNNGLCIEKLGKVKKYEVIPPENAFEKLKNEQEKMLDSMEHIAQDLEPIYNTQQPISSPLDFIEVYGNPCSIIKKHHTLETESREFVLSFCKAPYAMTKVTDIHIEQKESMKNGVVYKSIFEVEQENIEFFARRMKSFENQGEEVKIAYHLPIKLHVFDDQIVMFSMINTLNPKDNLTYMVIEHPDLAETLITTFYKHWNEAISVDDFLKKENIQL